MNCVDIKKDIGALIDDELGADERDRLDSHLLTCVDCRETLEWTKCLSNLLTVGHIDPPSVSLDERVTRSFREHYSRKQAPLWRRVAFGSFAIPKLAFATVLVLAIAGLWLAFQLGRINATTISIPAYADLSSTSPAEINAPNKTRTITVEVPVIRDRIITRTVYIRSFKRDQIRREDGGTIGSNALTTFSSIGQSGYFTDANLQGFQTPAEIGVRIIKEVKTK